MKQINKTITILSILLLISAVIFGVSAQTKQQSSPLGGGVFGIVDNHVYSTDKGQSQNINLTNYTFNLPYDSYVFISAGGTISHPSQLVQEGVNLKLDNIGITYAGYSFITNGQIGAIGGCYNTCSLPFQVQTLKYLQGGSHTIQLVGGALDGETSFSGISIAIITGQGNVVIKNQ